MAEHVRDLVAAYFDDRLTPSEWQRVLEHLRACDECNDYFEERRSLLLESEGRMPGDRRLTDRELVIGGDLLARRLAEAQAAAVEPAPAARASATASTSRVRSRPLGASVASWAGAAGLLALAAGGVLFLGRSNEVPGPITPPDYAARKSPGLPGVSADVECVQLDDAGKALPTPPPIKHRGTCSKESYVTLRVESFDAAFRHVAAAFLSDGGTATRQTAGLEDAKRFVIPDAKSEPIALGQRAMTVVALFSTRALSDPEGSALVELARRPAKAAGGAAGSAPREDFFSLPALPDGAHVVARVVRVESGPISLGEAGEAPQ